MTHTLRTKVSTELSILILFPFLKKNCDHVSHCLVQHVYGGGEEGGVCLFVSLVVVAWVRYIDFKERYRYSVAKSLATQTWPKRVFNLNWQRMEKDAHKVVAGNMVIIYKCQ